jgi:fucose permease
LVEDHATENWATTLRNFMPDNIPWASLYIVFAIVSFLLVLVVSLTKYPSYEKAEDEKAGDSSSYWELLKNKYTLLYFLGIFCYVGVEQGIGNWISQFLQEYHQLDAQTTGANTVAYFWAMLTFGCLLGLALLKVMDSRKLLIGATLTTLVCLFFALFGIAAVALIAFPMLGFSISVMWSIIFSLGLNSIKTHHGSLSGILCTGIAGGAILPFIVGIIGEVTSLKTALFFLIIPLVFILSIGFWAKPLVTNKFMGSKNEGK